MSKDLSLIRFVLLLAAFPSASFAQDIETSACYVDLKNCHTANVESLIEQPIANVRIGHDLVGDPLFPRRSVTSQGILIVELNATPDRLVSHSNSMPPDLEALVGRPDLQEAFDANALPGQFVTPPAIRM